MKRLVSAERCQTQSYMGSALTWQRLVHFEPSTMSAEGKALGIKCVTTLLKGDEAAASLGQAGCCLLAWLHTAVMMDTKADPTVTTDLPRCSEKVPCSSPLSVVEMGF